MNKQKQIILLANRIRTLAQHGLIYSLSEYDSERYNELFNISHQLIAACSGYSQQEIADCFLIEKDYVTPKVDIRAVVFNDKDEILLVKEKADSCWSLPGGWADVGYTPKAIAEKEVLEESGLQVQATKLLAVLDKNQHNHPPALQHAYKLFMLCQIVGGSLRTAFDILDCDFFDKNNIPTLSLERVLPEQIDLMFEYKNNPQKEVWID